MKQKDIFLKEEGNNWFSRNILAELITPDIHLVNKYLEKFPGNILEVGCSDGRKLAQYKMENTSRGYGIDPSELAVREGSNKYKNLNLQIATADELPFEDNFFDVVVCGFCFYLVDRNLLLKSISEIDRVLKDGGLLVITDFDPPYPIKRAYHHYEGLYSYKMNYEKLFLASSHYSVMEKLSYNHQNSDYSFDIQERISTTVMLKNIDNGYVAG